MVFVFVTSAFVSIFSMQCYADISIYDVRTNQQVAESYRSVASKFGPPIPQEGFEGYAVYAEPADGCSNLTAPPNSSEYTARRWIVLMKRGSCDFIDKVRNAQNVGYSMAIVHNNSSGELEPMRANNDSGIYIQSVFVSLRTGLAIKNYYTWVNNVYLVVDNDSPFPFDINADLLIPFAVVVAVCFITMISFMVCKCIRDRRRARRHRLPASSLRKIPVEKFSKGSPYETCAICLDDYIEGEKLRVLPCSHAYHTNCIDPWLTRNRRVCPICKRKVFAADELPIEGSETDSDSDNDERTPLVRSEASHQRQITRRVYLLSPTPISRLLWQHHESVSENNSTSAASSRSGSVGESEYTVLPAAIVHSINCTDADSFSSDSICSFNYTGRGSLQLPHSDNSDAQSRNNISVGSEADVYESASGSNDRVV